MSPVFCFNRLEKGWDYMRAGVKRTSNEMTMSSRLCGVIHHISKYKAEMGSPAFVASPVHFKNDWDRIDAMQSEDSNTILLM